MKSILKKIGVPIISMAVLITMMMAASITASAAATNVHYGNIVRHGRLDDHTGMVIANGHPIQCYKDSACTVKAPHYIWNVPQDWYKETGKQTSTSIYVTYPDTVPIDKADWNNGTPPTTLSYWFKLNDFRANTDSQCGYFKYKWIENKWYNHLPAGGITYVDEHKGGMNGNNDAKIYVSNNIGFNMKGLKEKDRTSHNSILELSDTTHIMSGKQYSVSLKYYPNYMQYGYLFDYHWDRLNAEKKWSTAGLKQGKNTIYMAGTDGSANYTLNKAYFLYDNKAPLRDITYEIASDDSSATVNLAGNDDKTPGIGKYSGIASIQYRYNYNGGKFSAWSTRHYNGNDPSAIENYSFKLTSGGDYTVQLIATDKAGNVSKIYSKDISFGKINSNTVNYGFHTNTDVVTHIDVTSPTDILPKDNCTVNLDIPGITNQTKSFVLGAGGTEPIAFEWRTPSSPTVIKYAVYTVRRNGKIEGSPQYAIYNIVALNNQILPDPQARDPVGQVGEPGNGGYQHYDFKYKLPNDLTSVNNTLAQGAQSYYKWYEWSMVRGKLHKQSYEASIASKTTIRPDPIVKTAKETGNSWTMKSGYPINCEVDNEVDVNAPGSIILQSQNVVTYYPEFSFGSSGIYYNVLEQWTPLIRMPYFMHYRLPKLIYSPHNLRVHYTPQWFANTGGNIQYDGKVPPYTVKSISIDAFCPEGELACASAGSVNIKGAVRDDYWNGLAKNGETNTWEPW